MNQDSQETILGEYRLKELLQETPTTLKWLAEQISVSRQVLVDQLRPECDDQRDSFLADVRAKAAVEHPLIGSVYEAVAEPGRCFFAHELLPGATLADREKAGEPFKPAHLAHLLRRIAEAQLHHEALGQSCDVLGLENVHLDAQGVIRMDNLAIGGRRDPEQSVRDVTHMGNAMRNLVADAQPGTTRMLTLFGWMRGEGVDAPIGWDQVRDICGQIEQQLAAPVQSAVMTRAAVNKRGKPPVVLITSLGVAALAVILMLAIRMRPEKPQSAPPAKLPGAILVQAGKYPTPDGTVEELGAFRISAHEVTIREYGKFLIDLETLADSQRHRIYDHESQPPEKTSHVPQDWDEMLSAAKACGTWKQYPVTLDSPVVGIDWWDAAAFAEWKKARLPTQEEWFAALRATVGDPALIPSAPWQPINESCPDRTTTGLLGMAGSVSEWTRRPATNPANPLGERKWLVIGGSYLKTGSNALTREWVDDRSLRRADVGFRLVFDAD